MPKLENASVTHEASITANMGDFESYKSTVSLTEHYSVSDLTEDTAQDFIEKARLALIARVDEIVQEEYNKNSKYAKVGK